MSNVPERLLSWTGKVRFGHKAEMLGRSSQRPLRPDNRRIASADFLHWAECLL
jgi:hypothetical protein